MLFDWNLRSRFPVAICASSVHQPTSLSYSFDIFFEGKQEGGGWFQVLIIKSALLLASM